MSADLEKMEKIILTVRTRIPEEIALIEQEKNKGTNDQVKGEENEKATGDNLEDGVKKENVEQGSPEENNDKVGGEDNEAEGDQMEGEDEEKGDDEPERDDIGNEADVAEDLAVIANASSTLPDGQDAEKALDMMDIDDQGGNMEDFELNGSTAGGLGEELAANEEDLELPDLPDVNEDQGAK